MSDSEVSYILCDVSHVAQIQGTSLPSKLVMPEGEIFSRTSQRQQWQRRRKPRKEQQQRDPTGDGGQGGIEGLQAQSRNLW